MKTLVVYDSNYGNTQKIAEVISNELGVKSACVSNLNPNELSGYNFLVVGTPIIGWKPTEGMQTFLSKLNSGQLNDVRATTFDTRVKLFIHGDAMGKLADTLKSFGAEIFVDPMPFYVAGPQANPHLLNGEVEKAKDWANKIKKLIER